MTTLLHPFEPLTQLQREMRELEDDLGFSAPWEITPREYPPINAWDEGEAAVIEAELPGLAIEDVSVLATGDEVTISGERKAPPETEGEVIRTERPVGEFRRTVRLPWEIETAAVTAKLVDGVLTVRLPKSANAKPRKIEVSGT